MQPISVTELRANLYKIVDRIIATGEPQEIMRDQEKLVLTIKNENNNQPKKTKGRLSRLKKHRTFIGDDYDELVNLKVWEWNEENL